MIADQVKNLCAQLRLLGIHNAAESRAAQALAAQMHPLEFLRLILEDEVLSRTDRLGKTLTTRAKFRFASDLEDWDASYPRGLTPAQLQDLARLDFVSRGENVLIFGKTGEGKTHLGIGLGRRLCSHGVQTLFLPVNSLFEEIAAAKAAGRYLALTRHFNRAKVLLLDDFGMRNYAHDEATALLDIIEDRYRKGTLIVTSQVHHRGWPQLFDDPVVAEAIIDRLLHPSREVILKGGSYRERLSKKRETTPDLASSHLALGGANS